MSRRLMQFVVATWAAASLVMSPIAIQAQQLVAQETQGQKAPPEPVTAPPPRNINLFTGQPDYSKGNAWFPNLIKPYESMRLPKPDLANSPRLDQLIANGKLMLSLQDAISLSLENNLNISVARYTPWIGETGILGANGKFDPSLTASGSIYASTSQFNNVFQGSGALNVTQHSTSVDFGYSQLFHTGTNLSVTWDNTRSSSNLPSTEFNPSVSASINASITQPLLNGFGILANTYQIVEAKNTAKADQAQFEQAVISYVTQTAIDYWTLKFAIENIKVEQIAVASEQQLYDDEKKQLDIGTAAPLDVITAQSGLASAQQALVQAQTTQLEDETVLLNDITKNPLASSLTGVEIVPTTELSEPAMIENIPVQDAVQEAWKNSPQLQQSELSLENAKITARVAKNSLLPKLNLSATYSGAGLRGVETVGGVVVVDNGLGNALNDVFHNDSPTYEGQLTLTLPIRNRAAQANDASALLTEQSQQVSHQATENGIFLQVHQAIIALRQDRAAVAAGAEAVKYNQESYDDEVKKLQLGTSTTYNVVLKQQGLTQAQAAELSARVSLAEDEWRFNQAMSRTLTANHIVIAGAAPSTRINGSGAPTQNAGGGPSAAPQTKGTAAGTSNGMPSGASGVR